jgi:hypothetical protein
LPSLELIAQKTAAERATMNNHAESLDTKAGVVLGFAGVLVGLGATAQRAVVNTVVFKVGVGLAVLSGVIAVAAFLPRRYPVVEVARLRERYLVEPEDHTRLRLLDTEIVMVSRAAGLVRIKGRLVRYALVSLVVAVALVVAGTLSATGGTPHG